MRKLFAAPLAAFSSYGWAQQLVAVAPPSDSSGLVIVAVVAIVAAVVFLKVKRPDLFAKVLARGKQLASRAEAVSDKVKDAFDKAPGVAGPPTTPGPFTAAAEEYERQRAILLARQQELAIRTLTPSPAPGPAAQSTQFINGRIVG